MEVTVDQVGRILVPKALRKRLGIEPGSVLDISEYGAGLQLTSVGRTARLEREDGKLVAVSSNPINDEEMFAAIDAGRR